MSNFDAEPEEYNVDDMEAAGFQDKGRTTPKDTISCIMDGVFGLLLVVLTGFFVYWSFSADGVVLFAWHPALMALGFILFMTQATNVFSNALLTGKDGISYSNRVIGHWLLHSIGMFCITGGFAAIYYNKIRLGKDHFHTPHSIFGLITFILMFFVSIGGVAAKYSFQLRRLIRPVQIKVVHSLFGLIVYWLGGITLLMGVAYTHWFQKHRTKSDAYFSIAAILFIWIYTTIRPLSQAFRRLRQMFTSI